MKNGEPNSFISVFFPAIHVTEIIRVAVKYCCPSAPFIIWINMILLFIWEKSMQALFCVYNINIYIYS